jgi:hypothetical protein
MAAAVVIGLRARTGAAELIALAAGPTFVAREHFALAADGAEYCYHAAAEMTLAHAKRHVAKARDDARARALVALRPIAMNYGVKRAAVVRGKGKPLPELDAIVKVHALWHAAEGELYRDALADACRELGIAVIGVPQPELQAPPATLATLGKVAGKPWTVEQKEAAMAAILALDASP